MDTQSAALQKAHGFCVKEIKFPSRNKIESCFGHDIYILVTLTQHLTSSLKRN